MFLCITNWSEMELVNTLYQLHTTILMWAKVTGHKHHTLKQKRLNILVEVNLWWFTRKIRPVLEFTLFALRTRDLDRSEQSSAPQTQHWTNERILAWELCLVCLQALAPIPEFKLGFIWPFSFLFFLNIQS